MIEERDWLDQLADDRAAVDPEFARMNRRAQIMVQLLPLRKHLGLTQVDLANRMHIARAQVAKIESAPHKVSLDKIFDYAAALGATIEIRPPETEEPVAVATGA